MTIPCIVQYFIFHISSSQAIRSFWSSVKSSDFPSKEELTESGLDLKLITRVIFDSSAGWLRPNKASISSMKQQDTIVIIYHGKVLSIRSTLSRLLERKIWALNPNRNKHPTIQVILSAVNMICKAIRMFFMLCCFKRLFNLIQSGMKIIIISRNEKKWRISSRRNTISSCKNPPTRPVPVLNEEGVKGASSLVGIRWKGGLWIGIKIGSRGFWMMVAGTILSILHTCVQIFPF